MTGSPQTTDFGTDGPALLTERVARAICRAWLLREGAKMFRAGELGAADIMGASTATIRAVNDHWPEFIDEAEAAIAAILEDHGDAR